MNKLDIDNRGNIIIFNTEKSSDISFFLEEFFDNSLSKLKEDIEVCQDPSKKNILIQFAEKYEKGELDFISDYWQNDETIEYKSTNPSFEFGYNRDGTGEFTSHDVSAVHSGFWYATDNLDKEIKNISQYKHNYEGFIIASEKIDNVISIIKSTPDYESAVLGIQDLGLTRLQAEAVMSSRLDRLTWYEAKFLQDRIECCEKLSIILNGILNVNENEKEHDAAFYAAQLQKSPMFQLSLSSKELFHSNFLYWISQISREMFKKVINELLISAGNTPIFEWPEYFDVKREYNNFDLCVINGTNNKILLVIENKVKSIPRYSQLEGYSKISKDANHLLLSLSTTFPNRDKILELSWDIADYGMLSDILNDCISTNRFNLNSYHTAIISDYANFVSKLHKLQELWQIKMDETFIPKEHLYGLRINDLQEKHRFSNLYALLKQQFEERMPNITIIEDSTRKEIFTKSHKPRDRKIFLGWGMTRAQGLLEAKILVEENVVLLVQIQGNQYRHCVELRNKRNADENWDIYSNKNTLTAWFISTANSNAPFRAFDNSPLDIRPDTTRHDKLFNQYGNEFLYKSISIPTKATVREVIEMLIYDCGNILNHINQKS